MIGVNSDSKSAILRCIAFFIMIALSFNGCNSKTSSFIHSTDPNPSVVETTSKEVYKYLHDIDGEIIRKLKPREIALGIPVLCEEEFYIKLNNAIMEFAESHSLFLKRLDTRMPYYNYFFVVGKPNEDGTYSNVTLPAKEYEQLFHDFDDCLLETIESFALETRHSIFNGPTRDIVGIFLYNSYNNTSLNRIEDVEVGQIQINLSDFYYSDSWDYTMFGFEDTPRNNLVALPS